MSFKHLQLLDNDSPAANKLTYEQLELMAAHTLLLGMSFESYWSVDFDNWTKEMNKTAITILHEFTPGIKILWRDILSLAPPLSKVLDILKIRDFIGNNVINVTMSDLLSKVRAGDNMETIKSCIHEIISESAEMGEVFKVYGNVDLSLISEPKDVNIQTILDLKSKFPNIIFETATSMAAVFNRSSEPKQEYVELVLRARTYIPTHEPIFLDGDNKNVNVIARHRDFKSSCDRTTLEVLVEDIPIAHLSGSYDGTDIFLENHNIKTGDIIRIRQYK